MGRGRAVLSRGPGVIPAQEGVIPRREGVISRREGVISRREGVISRREEVISRREGVISRREGVISRREGVISRREGVITATIAAEIDTTWPRRRARRTSPSSPRRSGTRLGKACFKLSTQIGRLVTRSRRVWTERRRGVTPRGRIWSQTRSLRKRGVPRAVARGAVMTPSRDVMTPSRDVMTRSGALATRNDRFVCQWHTLASCGYAPRGPVSSPILPRSSGRATTGTRGWSHRGRRCAGRGPRPMRYGDARLRTRDA
jgi:hypothetical protein